MLTSEFRATSLPWISVLVVVTLMNAGLLWWFHDRTWWGPDDGQLVHVADRILSGDVLHRDIQDVRPGYVNFINAAALYIFGSSLVSLRFPLTIIVLVQSALLFFLLRPYGAMLAGSLSLSSVALGFIHYINPNHNWYTLFFTILLICHLVWTPRTSSWRIPLAGLLIVTIGLTRHLTGAFVGIGTLSYLLFEESQNHEGSFTYREHWMGRLLCASMLVLISLYLWKSTDSSGFFLFGLWPVVFLAWQMTTTTVPNNRTIRIIGGLFLGIGIGALPLLSYHITNGSLPAMIDDNFVRTLEIFNWDYPKAIKYWMFLVGGMLEFARNPGGTSLLNSMYWLVLPLAASLNGLLLLYAVRHNSFTMPMALPIIAMFYSLVSLFNQIPVYLYFTLILSIAGSQWLLVEWKPRLKMPMAMMLFLLSGVGVAFHAGEPLTRGMSDYMQATKIELFDTHGQLPKVGLWINQDSLNAYKKVVHIIEAETGKGDYLFAVPNNSELYFMTERQNPFRFFSTDHGVLSETEVEDVIQTLKTLHPRIITFAPNDKRNTIHSLAIMDHVREHSQLLSKDHFFEVYRYGGTNRMIKNDTREQVTLAQN